MKYRFVIDYTPTDPAGVASQRVCSPTYGDDLALSIEMESDEWYRKRKLEGKLTFLREDYGWIMRYGEKNGMTASQVLRKALRTYQMAVAAKAKQKTKEQE